MFNILAIIILAVTYLSFGLWHLSREWQHTDDLDSTFFWSLIPLAIFTWLALYLAGA